MKKKEFITIREYFNWLYANLSMAHSALKNHHQQYNRVDYMIRAKIYKGLNNGTMHITSLYEDEKCKLNDIKCVYCGTNEMLTLDHLVPRFRGGEDSGDNLIYACKSCNSSKNKKDLVDWYNEKNEFPPILVLRRYLKLAYKYFEGNGCFEYSYKSIDRLCDMFRLDLLPYEFPEPKDLRL